MIIKGRFPTSLFEEAEERPYVSYQELAIMEVKLKIT
jgi:hypothetical protein